MGYKHFSKEMRMELAILRGKGYSMRDIASVLGVSHSSVVRELKRNSHAYTGDYDARKANHKSYVRRKYSKYGGMKICRNSWLRDYAEEKLKAGWTPEEISGRLRSDYGKTIVSFKSIYNWLETVEGQKFKKYLPYRRHKPGRRKKKGSKNHIIPNRVFIEDRPEVINQRKRLGDFEGDTLGKPRGSAQTLVGMADRKSRFLLARKVARLRNSIEDGFQVMLKEVKSCSLTLDNGVENVRHESLGIPTYFCHAYSSWEKGTIENTFQRLRRYIPKKARLEDFSEETIAAIVKRMNNTPRKCLGFRTPAEAFKEQLIT